MGPVTPRFKEHLGTTDIGIIKMRRHMLKEATGLQDGVIPGSAQNGKVFSVRATDVLLSPDADWMNDDKVKELMQTAW